MSDSKSLFRKRDQRHKRRRMHIRKKCVGSSERPRLVVFRSNRHIYAQFVDDLTNITISGCSTLTPEIKKTITSGMTKVEEAKLVGKHVAGIARKIGFNKVAFDRNGRRYHGRVKALAEAARKDGLEF